MVNGITNLACRRVDDFIAVGLCLIREIAESLAVHLTNCLPNLCSSDYWLSAWLHGRQSIGAALHNHDKRGNDNNKDYHESDECFNHGVLLTLFFIGGV